jgi:predicted dithiol-disulfide oxidoreductase (DUF899 family)
MTDEVRALENRIQELRLKLGEARRRSHRDEPVADYAFKNPEGSAVRLSELFGGRRDLLVVHNMGKRCTYCTLWADGLNGVREHLADRAAFVVCSPDEPAVMREFAASRGWGFRMVSAGPSAAGGFNTDLGFGDPKDGSVWPGISAFQRKEDGSIVRTGSDQFGPGDSYCAVWHILDLLKDGAAGWEPKYTYGGKVR